MILAQETFTTQVHIICRISVEHSVTLQFFAVGVSKDWINDKLYWCDYTLQFIEEYDEMTETRREVANTRSYAGPLSVHVDPISG